MRLIIVIEENFEKKGLIFSGINNDLGVVETIEIKDHPWFIAGQFHPELKAESTKHIRYFRDFCSLYQIYQ